MLAVLGLILVGLALVATIVYWGWKIDPAWLISGAIFTTVFSGNWANMGIPVPIDRLLLLAGIASVLIRWWLHIDRPQLRLHPALWLLAVAGTYAIASAMAVGQTSNQ